MKKMQFSIYDAKAQIFSEPIMEWNEGSALRAFIEAVNNPKSDYFRHPEDFTLYKVAEDWDPETGIGEYLSHPEPLLTAINAKTIHNGPSGNPAGTDRVEDPIHRKESSDGAH